MNMILRYVFTIVIVLYFALPGVAQETETEFSTLLEKATPTALPQFPVAKRTGSDVLDDGLKGRVKSVREEKEYLDGTGYPANRRFKTLQEYNAAGNLVRQVFADYRGNISFVVVYGYLDGKRVSKAGTSIRHAYDPPPMLVPLATPSVPQKKGDERYTSSWEYKYDEKGRLVEELQSNNIGEVINKTTYLYKPGQIIRTFCSLPCTTKFISTQTHDDQGNVIKSVYDNGQTTRSIDLEEDYKYLSFDEKGSWLKREVTGKIAATATTDKPIHYIEYRTITYFP